jgi:hypothetical protein
VSCIPHAEPVAIAVLGSFAVTAYLRVHRCTRVEAREAENFGDACHSVLAGRRNDIVVDVG